MSIVIPNQSPEPPKAPRKAYSGLEVAAMFGVAHHVVYDWMAAYGTSLNIPVEPPLHKPAVPTRKGAIKIGLLGEPSRMNILRTDLERLIADHHLQGKVDVDQKLVLGVDIFTTGDIANAFRVAPKTVGKWVDKEKIDSYRIPGSHDRRITRKGLSQLNKIAGITEPVLFISDNNVAYQKLQAVLGAQGFADFAMTQDVLDTTLAAQGFRPAAIIVDSSFLGPEKAKATLNALTRNVTSRCDAALVVNLVADDAALPEPPEDTSNKIRPVLHMRTSGAMQPIADAVNHYTHARRHDPVLSTTSEIARV